MFIALNILAVVIDVALVGAAIWATHAGVKAYREAWCAKAAYDNAVRKMTWKAALDEPGVEYAGDYRLNGLPVVNQLFALGVKEDAPATYDDVCQERDQALAACRELEEALIAARSDANRFKSCCRDLVVVGHSSAAALSKNLIKQGELD